jgi:uncharacterized OB-fold protein
MSVELVAPGCEALSLSPQVIKNVKDEFHIHTYGGLTRFFEGLRASKLLGTRCTNRACEENRIWLPPRAYCPDCLQPMEWVDAPQTGEIFTHTTVEYPGSNFKLSTPCPLISVSLEGVCTKMMSYLKDGRPEIGMKIRAWFRTENPTHTILDLAWVPL